MTIPNVFIFVRHGDTLKNEAGHDRRQVGLSILGETQARQTGVWLHSMGVIPDLVVHTNTVRTRKTARILSDSIHSSIDCEQQQGGFRKLIDLESKLIKWVGKKTVNVLLFCGHHTSQQDICHQLNIPLGRKDRAVVLLRRMESSWVLAGLAAHRQRAIGSKFDVLQEYIKS